MSAALPLSVAVWNYDRTLPLIDRRVAVPGFDIRCSVLAPESAFALAFGDAPFDVTEISLSNTITTVSKGACPYTLIPAFLSRAFRHSALFIRTDRGIGTPADLEGKTIGLQEFDMTAAVVLRGVLRDAYGVDTLSMRWMVGDATRTKPIAFPVDPTPARLRIEILPPGISLEERLLAGELDALVSLRTPRALRDGDPRIARAFDDPALAEREWFQQARVFPIMHAVGVKSSLIDEHPDLAPKLLAAFSEAKALAIGELDVIQAPKVTLPWVGDALRETRRVLGEDFWPYGVAANRHALETQLRWSREDGLQARKVSVEELFASSVLDT
jgi:4,5-dihydroxyphthalate decarboxylase